MRLAFRNTVEQVIVEKNEAIKSGTINTGTAEGRRALRDLYKKHGVHAGQQQSAGPKRAGRAGWERRSHSAKAQRARDAARRGEGYGSGGGTGGGGSGRLTSMSYVPRRAALPADVRASFAAGRCSLFLPCRIVSEGVKPPSSEESSTDDAAEL